MDQLHPNYRPKTLCEVCSKATGFCPWSEKGNMRPVPGWDAIRSGLKYQGTSVESYIVLCCPQFSLEEKFQWAYERFNPERIRRKLSAADRKTKTWGLQAVRCVETGVVYASIKEAAKSTGVYSTNIGAACRGQYRTAGGYRWEYVEED